MTMHEDGSDRGAPDRPETSRKESLFAKAQWRLANDPRWATWKFSRVASHALRNRMMAKDIYQEELSKSDDPLRNLQIRSDERVELPVLWVAELYSPSYAAGLAKALKHDPWGTFAGEKLENPLRLIRDANTFSSRRIGTFVGIDSKTLPLFMDERREHLPDGIRSIMVRLETITPALTAVVATCHLNPEGKDSLDKALKADYRPRLERPGGGIQIFTRRDEAVRAVQRERERIHGDARRWLAGKLPGIFATEGDGQLPVLDVLLTHGYDPLIDSSAGDSDLRSALDMRNASFGRTVLTGAPAFRLDQDQALGESICRWTLSAKFSAAFPDERFEHSWGETRSAEAIAGILGTKGWGRSLLIRLAISQLIDVKIRGMNRSRDLANSIHDGRAPVRGIKRLRRALLTNSLDLDAIATGITEFTADPHRYEMDMPALRFEQIGSNTYKEDVLSGWAKTQAKSLKDLLEADRSMTGRLEVVASLTSSLSGIRSQRWAAWLSVVAIGVAAAAGYLTLIASQVTAGH